jgi:hypothetical protein
MNPIVGQSLCDVVEIADVKELFAGDIHIHQRTRHGDVEQLLAIRPPDGADSARHFASGAGSASEVKGPTQSFENT